MTIFVKAPAKVNLYLDVIGKDPQEDYHLLSTILATVPDFFDEITIEPLEGHFQIFLEIDPESKYSTPEGEDNACFKAASLLRKAAMASDVGMDLEKKLTPVKIILKKNIPNKAGLGGGSSDAAATIKALNKLWDLKFTPKKLMEIASQISMESAFFIEGSRYAYCTHFGEIIEPLESDLDLNIEIIETGIEIDPEWAYNSIDLEKCRQNKDKARVMVGALIDEDRNTVLENLHNDFEYLVLDEYPELKKIVEERGGLLCGSGGCVAIVS